MRLLSETREYRAAYEILGQLKQAGTGADQLRAIAAFLIVSHDATLPDNQFPYRGVPGDPRDADVVEAYREAWQEFIQGDDDQE